MTLISIVTIISFLLEGVFSNMVNITNSFFVPLFSIIILIVISWEICILVSISLELLRNINCIVYCGTVN